MITTLRDFECYDQFKYFNVLFRSFSSNFLVIFCFSQSLTDMCAVIAADIPAVVFYNIYQRIT